MNRVHEDAAANGGVGSARKHLCEVEDNLRGAVGDNSEVAIGALSHFGREVELQILLGVIMIIVCPSCELFT